MAPTALGQIERPNPFLEMGKKVGTTTVSSIAVQSGNTRIVIALLQSGSNLRLKVLELEPGIAYLGNNFSEAAALQNGQNEVISKLQSKQSPVEDLLRQADQLIANQQPRAEVYAAMAESLGLAWRDLNSQLEQRKVILDQNYMFQGHFQDYLEKVLQLEKICSEAETVSDVSKIKQILRNLLSAKKSMLESSVYSLQEGESLLEKLHGLYVQSSMDSRPNFIKNSVAKSIEQVEIWLESLHDKRVNITLVFTATKDDLTRRLSGQLILSNIDELNKLIHSHREALLILDDLGDSVESSKKLLDGALQMEKEAHSISEKCLKSVKSAQALTSSNRNDSMEASIRAYDVLEQSADYQQLLDNRKYLLNSAIDFFEVVNSALRSLDSIEKQISGLTVASDKNLLDELVSKTKEVVARILEEGNMLSEKGGNGPGTKGIRNAMEEIKKRAESVFVTVERLRLQLNKNNEMVDKFNEKYEELFTWITVTVTNIMKENSKVGTDVTQAKKFQDVHRELSNHLNVKSFEIDALQNLLGPSFAHAPEELMREAQQKVIRLREAFQTSRNLIENRINISEQVLRFLKLSEELSKEMNVLETKLADCRNLNETVTVEQSRMIIQQLYLQVCNIGKNLQEDLNNVKDVDNLVEHNNMTDTINNHLDIINRRQTTIIEQWSKVEVTIKESQQNEKDWDKLKQDAQVALELVKDLNGELYPVIVDSESSLLVIKTHIQDRQVRLPKAKMIPRRLDQLARQAEEVSGKVGDEKQNEAENLAKELREEQRNVQDKLNEYEVILEMISAFFKNLEELDKMMVNLAKSYQKNVAPKNVAEAEQLLNEHNSDKNSVLNVMKFCSTERDGIIEKIKSLKTLPLYTEDVKILLAILEEKSKAFEETWMERQKLLENHLEFCKYAAELKQTMSQIDQLGTNIKTKLTIDENIASIRSLDTQLNPIKEQFKTVEAKVEECLRKGEELEKRMKEHSETIQSGIDQLREKWATLQKMLEDQKAKLSTAVQYFSSVEKSEAFIKQTNKQTIHWSQNITTTSTIEKAEEVKRDIEEYINREKSPQEENMTRLTAYAGEIYGQNALNVVKNIQVEVKESFNCLQSLVNKLSNLIENMIREREDEAKSEKIRKEAELSIQAAQLEAEIAKQAAKEAEESRKAAEEAARLLAESKEQLISTHETQTDTEEPPPRPPLPEPVEEPRPVAPLFTENLEDIVIMEGNSCTFKAQVSGVPAPKITWFKDGIPVGNNTDYRQFYENGLCCLTIDETFGEDSANWSVRASNQAGYAESHAKLTVKEQKPVEKGIAPEFITPLKDSEALEGGFFEFKCIILGNPNPQVSWFKNGICIDKSRHYTIGEYENECLLRIDKVFLEDATEFSCRISNIMGQAISTAALAVTPLEPTELPSFEIPLSNVMARTGQEVVLECKVTGIPTPDLYWYHNNKPIKKAMDIDATYDGKFAKLVIAEAYPKVAGQYICKAQNIAGEATSTSTVYFKGILPETSDSEAQDENVKEQHKPAFYVPLKNMECTEKEDIVLECVIVGNPEPEVIWYKDDVPVKESESVNLLFEGDSCKLVLKNVNKSQAGNYKVRAINSHGESYSTCQIKVNEIKTVSMTGTQTTDVNIIDKEENFYTHSLTQNTEIKSSFISESSNRNKPKKMSAPKFVTPIQGSMVEEGAKIEIEGIIEGCPEPKITWLKNGQMINPSFDLQITFKNKKTILSITKVREHHAGKYTCRAENMAGSAESTADLVVRKKQLSPVFLRRLQSQTLLAGHRLVAEVEVGGLPAPSVSWYFNDQIIVNCQGKEIRQSGSVHGLVIASVTASDSGKYTVKASNTAGEAICVADIDIFEEREEAPPRPPEPEIVTKEEEEVITRPELGDETQALRTLASHKRQDRPLPDLLPFPFKAEETTKQTKKNYMKVPKPSKFVKGEMYHSDYESEFEGKIGVKWRASASDTEDCEHSYKKIEPQLKDVSPPKERNPSPPCPHKWESHEEIERLTTELQNMKKTNQVDHIRRCQLEEKIETLRQTTKIQYSEQHLITEVRQQEVITAPKINSSEPPAILNAIAAVVTKPLDDPEVTDKEEVDQTFLESVTLANTVPSTNKSTEEGHKCMKSSQLRNMWEMKMNEEASSVIKTAKTKNTFIKKSQSFASSSYKSQTVQNSTIKSATSDLNVSQDSSMISPPPPIPPKTKSNILTPSPSRIILSPARSADSGSFSDEMSSQSTVKTKANTTEYVPVSEKVKHFEQKVEEEYFRKMLEGDDESQDGTVRPELIPGAVRILPTPTPPGSRPGSRNMSRKNSLVRQSSVECSSPVLGGRTPIFSPVNVPPANQQLPTFGRKTSFETPPPMYKPPDMESKLLPFPFKPDSSTDTFAEKEQLRKVSESPKPSKFIKKENTEMSSTLSEKDISMKTTSVWSPSGQTSESQYRPVKVDLLSKPVEKTETFREPTPPTAFDEPPTIEGRPRPQIDINKTVEEIRQEKMRLISSQMVESSIISQTQVMTHQIQSKQITQQIKQNTSGFTPSNSGTNITMKNCASDDDFAPPRPPPPTFGEGTDMTNLMKSDTGSSIEQRSFASRASKSSVKSNGYTTSYTSPPPLESVKDIGDKDTTVEPSSCDEKKSPKLRRKSRSKEVLTDDDTDVESSIPIRSSRNSATPTSNFDMAENIRHEPHCKSPKSVKTEKHKSMDGYEADTETLTRKGITTTITRRGSVRDIASRFEQAELCSPSPVPRPKMNYRRDCDMESESESRIFPRMVPSKLKTPEPAFLTSNAYLAPKWAPPTEAQESNTSMKMIETSQFGQRFVALNEQTKVIRFNQQEIVNKETSECSNGSVFSLHSQKTDENIKNEYNISTSTYQPQEEFICQMENQVSPTETDTKHQVFFKPSKFVPGKQSDTNFSLDKTNAGKFRPKWAPSDSETDEPSYRPVKPLFQNKHNGQETQLANPATTEQNTVQNTSEVTFKEMSDHFKQKVQNFTENKIESNPDSGVSNYTGGSYAYHDKKSQIEKGEKQIDPNTGLVYFKYDFGYEFGVVVPEMGKIALVEKDSFFTKPLEDVYPTVNEMVTFYVEYTKGSNPIQTIWRRNNLPLPPDNDHYKELSKDGESTLSIRNVLSEDNGEYSCSIITRDTTHTTTAKMIVQGESLL